MSSEPEHGGGGQAGSRVTDDGGLACTYVLAYASDDPLPDPELTEYLTGVAARCELVVVDGSPPEAFAAHGRLWGGVGRHLPPDAVTPMGKVGNVLTGLAAASHDRVVLADDDVRYGPELDQVVARLDVAEIVRPQNFFEPLPWHAVWDSARSLVARRLGGDWPGTLAVRRDVVLRAGGYAGDVLFENFELWATVVEAGGRSSLADDCFVRRRPPTARHFLGQRVRQAYDELARPWRLAPFLALGPVTLLVAVCAGRRILVGWLVTTGALAVAVAEAGRRRADGRHHFPLRCSLAAPLWCAERAICAWLAIGARLRGGVSYRGRRLRRAALTPHERRRRIASAGA